MVGSVTPLAPGTKPTNNGWFWAIPATVAAVAGGIFVGKKKLKDSDKLDK